MPKLKGRKQRQFRTDRINFLMRLCPDQHQQLKRLAEDRQETIALIIERYIGYMLMGEVAKLDRQQEQERMAVSVAANFDSQLYQQAYSEVESLVGAAWLKMTDKQRRALSFLAMFPYEAGYRLARMVGITRQWLQKIKESAVGIRVINHFSDRSLWSARPELLRSVLDKAIESGNPAWSELAMRIFGEYRVRTGKQEDKPKQEKKNNNFVHKPPDLDRQLISRAKQLNMTPKRFAKLWEQEQVEQN